MRERDDHFIHELVSNPHSPTGKSVKVTTPSDVLKIQDKRELYAQLDHYSQPFIRLSLPNDPFARKHYVEKVRPALRYYCKKFGVKVPDWLANDDYFKNMPDDEKRDMFGTHQLSHREFEPRKMVGRGTVTRG